MTKATPAARSLALALLSTLYSVHGTSQPLLVANRPEDVEISSQRLGRVHRQLKSDVDNGLIPGAVLLIARQGKIADLHAVGFQDRRSRQPMLKNCIFRIASMSKPITSVGAMILAEEGKLDIAAPVEQYLPEFKGVSVGAARAVPSRPVTVQDLLRHTSGLTYGIGDSAVDKLYRESNLFANSSLADFVQTVARLPLAHQPGAQWEYSVSTDVLGRIIEKVSGMELDRFVREHICRPLGLTDTVFYLDKTQAARFARPDAGVSRTALDTTDPGEFDPTFKPSQRYLKF